MKIYFWTEKFYYLRKGSLESPPPYPAALEMKEIKHTLNVQTTKRIKKKTNSFNVYLVQFWNGKAGTIFLNFWTRINKNHEHSV